MTSTNEVILLVFGTCSIFADRAEAYYCEWSLCEPDLYCCGNNQCCSNVYSPWYFWAGAVVIALLLWSCSGMLRYCYANRNQGPIKYQEMNPSSSLNYHQQGNLCTSPIHP